MNDNHSSVVASALMAAGWLPGRMVDVSALENLGATLFPAARKVLVEFYGLHIGYCGPGIECATSGVHIDPSSAVHIIQDLQAHERILCVRLFPLGEVHRSHGFVLIDDSGGIYLYSDEIEPFARSFDDALERLLKGLLPDKT